MVSKIEWTGETLEATGGCEECSPGCRGCYARLLIWRLAHNPVCGDKYKGLVKKVNGKLRWTGKIKLFPEHFEAVLKRKKPTTYFIDSRSDLFHPSVPFDFIDKGMYVIGKCPQHTFQILTKRPELTAEFTRTIRYNDILPNVWLGVTIEHPDYKSRADILRQIPAAVRFLSIEPCLADMGELNLEGIDWVILGGESGPGARPMHPDWARGVRDQCQAAGVLFFFKQWGEWEPAQVHAGHICKGRVSLSFDGVPYSKYVCASTVVDNNCHGMAHVGKKKAGRLLDGKEHRQYPNK